MKNIFAAILGYTFLGFLMAFRAVGRACVWLGRKLFGPLWGVWNRRSL